MFRGQYSNGTYCAENLYPGGCYGMSDEVHYRDVQHNYVWPKIYTLVYTNTTIFFIICAATKVRTMYPLSRKAYKRHALLYLYEQYRCCEIYNVHNKGERTSYSPLIGYCVSNVEPLQYTILINVKINWNVVGVKALYKHLIENARRVGIVMKW